MSEAEDTTRRRYWVKTKLTREEIDDKSVYFHVKINEHQARGIGTLRFRSRTDNDLVCIDLVFPILPPDGDYRSQWHETHGLPQEAADALEVIDHEAYDFILDYRHNIRELPDQGLEGYPSQDHDNSGDPRV